MAARILGLLLLGMAGVLLVGAVAAVGPLQARLAARAGSYLESLVGALGPRLLLAATLVGASGLLTLVIRRPIGQFLDEAAVSAPAFWRDLVATVRFGGKTVWSALALAAIVALAAALRVAYLGQPMRYDEAFTYTEFAAKPLWLAASFYPSPNNHILHTLLVHVSTALFGNDPWAIRLPTFLAGTLMVPATFALGAVLYGRRAGLLGAALVAASEPLVAYSTNARGYTLQFLLTLVTFAFAAYARKRGNGFSLLLAAAFAILGAYTMPTMLYGFGAVLIWLVLPAKSCPMPHGPGRREASEFGYSTHPLPLPPAGGATPHHSPGSTLVLTRPSRPARARWEQALVLGFLVGVGALLLYLPPLLVSGPESIISNRWVRPVPWGAFPRQAGESVGSVWALWNRGLPLPLVGALMAGVLVTTVQHRRLARLGPPPLLAVLLWCLPVLAVQRVVPYERVWLMFQPLYFLTASAGLAHLAAWPWRYSAGSKRPNPPPPGTARRAAPEILVAGAAVLLAVALAASVVAANTILRSQDTGVFPDAEAVTRYIQQNTSPSEPVRTVQPTSLPQLQYYFPRFGLDPARLVGDLAAADRVVLIAPDDTGARAPERLAQEGIAPGVWSEPRLLARFPGASIYELTRQCAPAPCPGGQPPA